MAGESGRVAEVIQQEGDRVVVSVPMVGFPPGFKLRPGEKVVLVNDEGGPSARPLVRALAVDNVEADASTSLRAAGRRFARQESTILDQPSAERLQGPQIVFVVDQGSAEGPEQVLAVRQARPKP